MDTPVTIAINNLDGVQAHTGAGQQSVLSDRTSL